jgi:hypothetical protein
MTTPVIVIGAFFAAVGILWVLSRKGVIGSSRTTVTRLTTAMRERLFGLPDEPAEDGRERPSDNTFIERS